MAKSAQIVEIDSLDEDYNLTIDPLLLYTPLQGDQPFVHAVLFLKAQLKELLDTESLGSQSEETSSSLFETSSSPPPFDPFHFGWAVFPQLERFPEEKLFTEVRERRDELKLQKELWRPFVDTMRNANPGFYAEVDQVLKEGKLIPQRAGSGSAYYLVDGQNKPRFVVKPIDEDVFCLNNRKQYGSPFKDEDHRARKEIPAYRSAQTDAFCWEIALLSGLEETTPQAAIVIMNSSQFYDATQNLDPENLQKVIQETGLPDREKLCSVQTFIPDAQSLNEQLHTFYAAELTEEQIAASFDQEDFENACLFLWLTYDNDGHGGNFLTFAKNTESEKKIYGIKKIDNSLSFPERNSHYINNLAWMPNALLPLSERLKRKIAELPVATLVKRMDDYGLSNCKDAFLKRLEIIQTLSKKEGATLVEIDLRLGFLARRDGSALQTMTTAQILELLGV